MVAKREYRLPSKNAYRPIILFMVTCVFIECYSNFYCKIALINRFKLYLIKILTIRHMSHQQKQRRIYLIVTFSNIVMIHSRPWRVDHWIMIHVTWQHFDQSAKQLIFGHTTIIRWYQADESFDGIACVWLCDSGDNFYAGRGQVQRPGVPPVFSCDVCKVECIGAQVCQLSLHHVCYVTPPRIREPSIVMSVSVCLCMFVCPRSYLWN